MLKYSGARCLAFGASLVRRNFFPLGYSSGPKNRQILLPPNNFDGRAVNSMRKLKSSTPSQELMVSRDKLKLFCENCRFCWVHDTLTVRCPAHPTEHNQREIWIHPTWTWGRQQPFQYYKYLPLTKNPRTLMPLAREDAKSMNNERRAQGLTTRTRLLQKDKQGIARRITGLGVRNLRWQTRFPFPT
ncbi:unnamed protein product [Phytomonas sp. Hart1]|nr:unnamed protein product [Phytomonas sp. Hart1]|eukprot:CCW69834.1 unnamed protein product [Phytomonas sp. isolate Hart1]